MFRAYFEGFRHAVPFLPALLPEVWLHWDPRTLKERGPDALPRFRMDFLLLLPQGVRVVIEVDGKHHYADATGSADVQRYGHMVKADRELKFAGYEVFRFGMFLTARPNSTHHFRVARGNGVRLQTVGKPRAACSTDAGVIKRFLMRQEDLMAFSTVQFRATPKRGNR